jgi:polysaccharide export outer membrane protein
MHRLVTRKNRRPTFARLALLTGLAIAAIASGQGKRPVSPDPAPAPSYVIGPGDVLQINVWKEPEASSGSVIVRPDGMVTLPLVKEIKAAGLTPAQMEAQLTAKLSKQINDADVTVIVREIVSQKVYLLGAVRNSNPIILRGPLTILQAIAEAGGVTDYAKKGSIFVLRQDGSQQNRIPFDYHAVVHGQHQEQNILLRPGDTIVVP